jgi:allantoin racemase
MARITLITPYLDSSPVVQYMKDEYKHLKDFTASGTDYGLDMPMTLMDIERMHGPLLDKAASLQEKGACDAIIIGCFGDPALLSMRQVVSMPVFGPGESALSMAAIMGHKIGIVVPQSDFAVGTELNVHASRFSGRVVKVLVTEEPIAETIMEQPDVAVAEMGKLCLKVIREDEADVVILGCIGFAWMAEQIRTLIGKEGFKTPIIEPGLTAYWTAKIALELGLNQDRRKLTV